ncbi:response regulator [Aurantibacter crassamenti]|uniref:ATP-binding protein n=1 Tax=Aurantibacter crassamenti TaxID=1837375 RepID=UPI00193970DC|nr:ATP-binding protein [Aurantibacter crassamenti]MBM1105973.1 response regulator [Aurantibacter crassamenti]
MPKLEYLRLRSNGLLRRSAYTLGLVVILIVIGLWFGQHLNKNVNEDVVAAEQNTREETSPTYLEISPKYAQNIDSAPYLSFSEIQKISFNKTEVPIERMGYHYWSRFYLNNTQLPSIDKYFELQFGTADELQLYVPIKNGVYALYKLGRTIPKVNSVSLNDLSRVFLETKELDLERPFYLLNRPMSIFGLNALYAPVKVSLHKAEPFLLSTTNKNRDRSQKVYDFWFYTLFGIIFSVFLFAIIRYFLTQSLYYLLYAAYLFFLGINTIHRIFIFQEILADWHPHLYFYLNQLGAIFGIFFHALFTFYFVNVRKNYPKLLPYYLAFLNGQIVFYVIYFTLIVFFPFYKYHEILIDIQIFTLIAINGILISYMMYAKRLLHTMLILIGSLMLIIGNFFVILFDNTFIMMPIVTLESILFITVFSYLDKIQYKKAVERDQLEELNAHKAKMFANITHEFRTPLTVILGMVDSIKENYAKTSYNNMDQSLEMIYRNGKNVLHLVNELLDLAKVESGSMTMTIVQINVVPFVKYVSESFHSLAETKKINLTVYSEIDGLQMDVDTHMLSSIISNLLSNAIKFTNAGGKIIVHLNKAKLKGNDVFVIKVKDNGLGLAEREKEHLFNRFYQVNNTTSRDQEGTGIGLSLVKEFVELMNGSIGVESKFGEGSTFTIQLPITKDAHAVEDPKVNGAKFLIQPEITLENDKLHIESNKEAPLVLIIEDNLDVAHYIKTCLRGAYRMLHAKDGVLGIDAAFEHIPDIIISDVMMPGKDGFEVCATLKADERTDHIPIIILTAKVTTEDRLTGLSYGADAYLAKPFDEKELFTRLNQLILNRKKLINKLEKNGLISLLQAKVENPKTKFLQQIIQRIHENIDNANFGPTQLAKEMHLSESQVYRKLKSITDKSTAIFIRSIRLQKAKELIKTTNKNISEIAYETGFKDPSWFGRAYKEEFGYSPAKQNK